jgi:hypothetical protein
VLLSDNFDYQTVPGDLIPGVLSEQELGSTLYAHVITKASVLTAVSASKMLLSFTS